MIRGVAAFLRWRDPGVAVYVKGTLAAGEPSYGLSDIDLVAVVPADPSSQPRRVARVAERWRNLLRLFPAVGYLVYLFVYDEQDLVRAASAPCLTFGLDGVSNEAAFLGATPLVDELGLQERPGLSSPASEWRLVSGPQRRLPDHSRDAQEHRIAAWLELQFWSRYLFAACVRPGGLHVSNLCVKLIAEPARILLKLLYDEEPVGRSAVLERALACLPEAEDQLLAAIELQQNLAQMPKPPLAAAIRAYLDLSTLIAAEFERCAEQAGAKDVTLLLGDASEFVCAGDGAAGLRDLVATPELFPLVDWRAVVVPSLPDETFALVDGDPTSPSYLAKAASAGGDGAYPALRFERLLVQPAASKATYSGADNVRQRSATFSRVKLRGLQCEQTDPVSFALLSGSTTASFPDLRGWSASDIARRAVAEHRAWLELPLDCQAPMVRPWIAPQRPSNTPSAHTVGRLLTAVRAGLFVESIQIGKPELALTAAAISRAMEPYGAGGLGEEACGAYRAAVVEGIAPSAALVSSLRKRVLGLPAYRR